MQSNKDKLIAQLKDWVSVADAADLLGVDRTQVWHLIHGDKIVAHKIGAAWIVHAPSLENYRKTKSKRGWIAGRKRSNK